jgi:hypothetical protein
MRIDIVDRYLSLLGAVRDTSQPIYVSFIEDKEYDRVYGVIKSDNGVEIKFPLDQSVRLMITS